MSLVATKVQNWRVQNPAFDKNMTRPSEYGALDFFVQQSNAANSIINPELQAKAFASIGRGVEIPVIDYDGGVTVANSRSCTIADAENVSKLYSVVFSTLQVGFTMVPGMYLNNEISYEHDFNRKMEKITRALANSLDASAVAALEANKTQVFKDTLLYSNTGNSLQVDWDLREDILGDMNPIQRANDYVGTQHIIGNAGVDSLIRKLSKSGLYNEINNQLEYSDKVLHFTNNLVNEAGKYASMYDVVDGNVGILTRVDREALRGASAYGHEWDIVNLPILNLPVGVHSYTSVGDQSAIGGTSTSDLTCGVKEYYGFSLDVAFIVAYNSDITAIANPIIKAEIAKASVNPAAQPVFVTNDNSNPVKTQEIA